MQNQLILGDNLEILKSSVAAISVTEARLDKQGAVKVKSFCE